MNTYKSRPHPSVYRKIYEQNFGPIPKDEQGRSYHIHHKDHDPFNNDPSNLEAIPSRVHMIEHLSERDFNWTAEKRALQSERFKINNPSSSPEIRAKIASSITERNLRMAAEGTHPSQVKYSCPHCSRIIGGKGNLTQHIRLKHAHHPCSGTEEP